MSDLVKLEQFDSREAAEVAGAILEANGIAVTYEADDVGAMLPHLGPVSLLVGEANENAARGILAEAEATGSTAPDEE